MQYVGIPIAHLTTWILLLLRVVSAVKCVKPDQDLILFKVNFSNLFVCLRFSWRYQLREFKSEFRVVAIDMRGYGESDLPLSPECYRFDYLVTDVKDIVEYLGKNVCNLMSPGLDDFFVMCQK